MAWKRQRSNGNWEYQVKKKGLLPKPISLTFKDEAEGDAYVDHLEKLLEAGIVPEEFKTKAESISTLGMAISQYLEAVHVTDDDVSILNALHASLRAREISKCDYPWAEEWIAGMRAEKLSPSTIRHKVGALARCLDWVIRRKTSMLVSNPLRMLPKRYATTATGKKDVERDRRLLEGEEEKILAILVKAKPKGRQRALRLPEADHLRLMFTLALETAMRMREIYTLTWDQVDIKKRTIYLDKTKNGDSRQVPMTSIAIAALAGGGEGNILPFWNGSNDPVELRRTTTRLSQQWQRIFSAAGCDGLRFHDLRHEATSRLYERTNLTDLQISRITGHKSLQMLRRYSNLRGSDLAERLW